MFDIVDHKITKLISNLENMRSFQKAGYKCFLIELGVVLGRILFANTWCCYDIQIYFEL